MSELTNGLVSVGSLKILSILNVIQKVYLDLRYFTLVFYMRTTIFMFAEFQQVYLIFVLATPF
jgi:hypothetical protein